MHAADVTTSKRLQRVRDYLMDGKLHSTLEIIQKAKCCAVNSIISELRRNGIKIKCDRIHDRWYYRIET